MGSGIFGLFTHVEPAKGATPRGDEMMGMKQAMKQNAQLFPLKLAQQQAITTQAQINAANAQQDQADDQKFHRALHDSAVTWGTGGPGSSSFTSSPNPLSLVSAGGAGGGGGDGGGSFGAMPDMSDGGGDDGQ